MMEPIVPSAPFAALMRGRRSIRSGFSNRPVPPHLTESIIACGLAAPSSKGAQPWRLHVVSRPALLESVARLVEIANAEFRGEYVPIDPETGLAYEQWSTSVVASARILREVPLGVFIENRGEFSRGRQAVADAPDVAAALVGYTLEVIGLGAAIENMWMAAEESGLQGVFVGDILIAEQQIRRTLGMNGDLIGVLALGYGNGKPEGPRRVLADRVVHH